MHILIIHDVALSFASSCYLLFRIDGKPSLQIVLQETFDSYLGLSRLCLSFLDLLFLVCNRCSRYMVYFLSRVIIFVLDAQ